MQLQDLFEELSLTSKLPWETDEDRSDTDEPRIRIYGQYIFQCLLGNLRSKAEALKKLEGADPLSAAGRPHLFLMNNAHYIAKAIRGGGDEGRSPSLAGGRNIASVLPEAFLDRISRLSEDEREKFAAVVWIPLIEPLKDTSSIKFEYSKGSSVLTLESGRQIKTRFTSFNTSLDDIYQHQKIYSVPDSSLRQRLRQQAKDAVLGPYTEFFNKVSEIQFSKKHMDQYLRFPPKTVSTMLDELYSG